jgi:hypothetical protein
VTLPRRIWINATAKELTLLDVIDNRLPELEKLFGKLTALRGGDEPGKTDYIKLSFQRDTKWGSVETSFSIHRAPTQLHAVLEEIIEKAGK